MKLNEKYIGFVGLGSMGSVMVSLLSKKKLNLIAYDINKEIVSKCKNECINNHKKGCPKKIEECGDFKPQPGDYHMLLTEGSLKNKKRIYKCPQMEKKIMNDNQPIAIQKTIPNLRFPDFLVFLNLKLIMSTQTKMSNQGIQ